MEETTRSTTEPRLRAGWISANACLLTAPDKKAHLALRQMSHVNPAAQPPTFPNSTQYIARLGVALAETGT